ncbi:MAG: asparagine synthase-related protein [Cyanobacteriota bacterium]|nr:asparagine synthase-related protein [Cyanobacteriota bacterium]
MQVSLKSGVSWLLLTGGVQPYLEKDEWVQWGGVAIAGQKPALSPRGEFAVVGDARLSDRHRLLARLGIDSVGWQGSDTEIIARAWERWGTACLQEIEGAFGFAVWEANGNRLWVARDRVGVKTLYYTQTDSSYAIASQLRRLQGYHAQQLDLVALRDYLCTAFVPGDRTFWQQVRELRPGTVRCLPDGTSEPYWQPTEAILSDRSLDWHARELRSRLEEVVRENLPHNEPVGVYLSGGLDSSCIAALAANLHDKPVHTYSIHFGKNCPNELEFSSLVAAHCQTQHHILEISPKQMWEQLRATMLCLDDPIGDPLTVPNFLLAQRAKQEVRVILNGEGGDPCFGGPKNQPMLLDSLYSPAPDAVSSYLASFKKCFLDLPRLLQPQVWETVKDEPSIFAPDLYDRAQYLNRLMLLNIKFKGADHILTKVNNLTSSAGLDGRSPLFDARIVELSLQIPPEYKLAGAVEKAVLKQAVADLLPEAIIQRPKSGMMVPVGLWFRKEWQRQARKVLLSRKAAIAPYFNRDLIRDWLNYRGDTWNRYGIKLWLLVSLEVWLQVHGNGTRK